jgi:hypothetical protein
MSDEKEQEHSRAGGLSEWKEQTGQRACLSPKHRQGREHRKAGTMIENKIQTLVMPGCPPQRPSASAGEKHLVAFTGCSSLAGEEQKIYRAGAQRRRGELRSNKCLKALRRCSLRPSASAGEKHLVAFTGCSSLAGEEQKIYRAEGLSEWKE